MLYTADITALIQKFGLVPQLYADDTQVYGWSSPVCVNDLLERLSMCFDDIYDWMRSNRLQLKRARQSLCDALLLADSIIYPHPTSKSVQHK